MMDLFGRQCVVVAIDAKRNYDVPEKECILFDDDDDDDDDDGSRPFWFEVYTYGGKRGTGIGRRQVGGQGPKMRGRRDSSYKYRPGRHKRTAMTTY